MISFVMINYFSAAKAAWFLNECKTKMTDEGLSYVIVDNSDKAEEWEKLKGTLLPAGEEFLFQGLLCAKSKDGTLCICRNSGNTGYAKGNNLGYLLARELHQDPYVLITNIDLIFPERFSFAPWITMMEKNPDIALIGPKIVTLDKDLQSPYQKLSYLRRWVLRLLFYPVDLVIKKPVGVLFHEVTARNYVYSLHGATLFFSAKGFEKMGMFDEHTFLYGEEQITGERIKRSKQKVLYDPTIAVTHEWNKIGNVPRKAQTLNMFHSETYYYQAYFQIPKSAVYATYPLLYFFIGKEYAVWFLQKIIKRIKN